MFLHTEAFEHRCLSTQKHLPRDALTYTRPYAQKLLDTDCFSENHRSFDTEKPLHRESYTHRSFYTHKLFHRSVYTEKLLSTGAFTHRRLYTQKLVHTEAFTHRSFYTEKPLHTDAFPQKKRFHRAALTHLISPKNIPNNKEAVAVQFLGCPAPPPVLQSRTSMIFFLCIKFRRIGLFPLTQQPGSGRLAIRSPDQKMVSENEVDPTRGNSWGT